MEYSYGLQVVASEYEIDESARDEWDGLVGVLGTPRQMRLTSYPTRHFLGQYVSFSQDPWPLYGPSPWLTSICLDLVF